MGVLSALSEPAASFVLFVGQMMADDTAAERAEHGVMTGVVAGDAADDRALEATLGVGGRGRRLQPMPCRRER